jgi:hypothetical protein
MDWLLDGWQSTLSLSTAPIGLESTKQNLDGVDSGLDPWLPPTIRTVILGTTIPASIALFTLLYDLSSAIRWPKLIQYGWHVLKAPFTDFMGLQDLDEKSSQNVVQPQWKLWILVVLSTAEAAGWATVVAYEAIAGDVSRSNLIQAGVIFLAWVSIQKSVADICAACSCYSRCMLREG